MINARWTLENWPWLDEKRRRKERREDKCESRAGTCVRVLMKPRGRWFRGMDTKKKEGERERERGGADYRRRAIADKGNNERVAAEEFACSS